MEFETLSYEVRGATGWLTLDRPEALNAINDVVIRELHRALDAAEADDGLRVLVLTGAGRAFCAGGDLAHILGLVEGGDAAEVMTMMHAASAMYSRLEAFAKPVLAAVNGIAVAGGLELLLCCDIVLAAESARIGDAHANYGLVPGGGGSIRLPRKIGPARAKYLLMTGDMLPAATLRDWGLVHEVVPDGELTAAAEALAARLAEKSPLVLRRMKRLVEDGLDMPLAPALAQEMRHWEAHAGARDLREGLRAFAEKRAPEYTGR